MKTHVSEWRILMKAIDQAITCAEEQALPLVSIELDSEEWDNFVIARTTLNNGKRLDTAAFATGNAGYRGIKIYRGAD